MSERNADKRHRPVLCTECPIERVLDALETGGEIRRVDFCPSCWETLTRAAGEASSVLVLRPRA